jgi:threonine/homoserine/homoserine lactone efflux protein
MNSMYALPAETVLAFAVFALVASITPGPNNAMLMASGANFGFRRTLPHMAGVVLGFEVLLVAVGLGLGGLFAAFPVLQDVLFVIGGAYLLWLAWKIASANSIGGAAVARPMTFLEVVAFQWVNPKAWTGAIGAMAAYAPKDNYAAGVAMIALVFILVNIPVVILWTGGGVALRRFLERPGALRAFNVLMGLALALSLVPLAIERLMPPIRLF